jgi:hypothetical protein
VSVSGNGDARELVEDAADTSQSFRLVVDVDGLLWLECDAHGRFASFAGAVEVSRVDTAAFTHALLKHRRPASLEGDG